MNFALTLLCLILFISGHELGHAFAMRRHNIQIERICLLGFGPKLFEFRLTRWFGDVPIEVRLFPLGASVTPVHSRNKDPMDSLSFLDKSEIMGAGIMSNIFMAIIFLVITWACYGIEYGIGLRQIAFLFVCMIVAFACLKWQRWISPVLPLVGTVFLGLLVYGLYIKLYTTSETITGPIETIKYIKKESATFQKIHETFSFASSLSLGLAILNSMPFLPLDGGHILMAWIKKILGDKRFERIEGYVIATLGIPGALLLIAILGNDLYKFVRGFF